MAILTDDNYVDKAEAAVQKLKKNKQGTYYLTTSQIRNLLSLTSSLYDKSNSLEFEKLQSDISYLRVQFVYQAGRNSVGSKFNPIYPVNDLVEKADILNALKEVSDKETLQRFCRYMEALVAYFKFYGGKD